MDVILIVFGVSALISCVAVPATTILNWWLAPKCCGAKTVYVEHDLWICPVCRLHFATDGKKWYRWSNDPKEEP